MAERKEMNVTLIRHTLQPEELIALSAKLCYSKSTISGLSERVSAKDQSDFIERLMNMGHESTFEHASFTFGIEGVSRVLLAQLTRHRLASFSVQYPLGHGDKSLLQEPVFATLGQKYGKTPAQIILRWHTQMGFVVIPGSRNVDHIRDNLNILDFTMTDDERAEIAKLDKGERYYHRTDEQLDQFAAWRPEFEKA